jgi:hypothetical protein
VVRKELWEPTSSSGSVLRSRRNKLAWVAKAIACATMGLIVADWTDATASTVEISALRLENLNLDPKFSHQTAMGSMQEGSSNLGLLIARDTGWAFILSLGNGPAKASSISGGLGSGSSQRA